MKNNIIFPKVSVLGAGSWGTAIVKILSENLPQICWYIRDIETLSHIKKHRHNPKYISNVELHTEKLILTTNLQEALTYADYIILVIPSAFLHSEMQKITTSISSKVIFSAIKGIVPEYEQIVGEYIHRQFNVPMNQIGVITGPCHAEEVAMERLSYLTIACNDEKKAKTMAQMMQSFFIRTKISADIIGTEYAAMLKNIYAIAAGIAYGLGYGDNFQSVLMSNSIREMQRYIKRIHKIKRNINATAYLGDLLVTGYSLFSRNRMLGTMLGKGYTIKSAITNMNMIAEGYYATKSAYKIIREKEKATKTPILNAVHAVLYEGKNAKDVFEDLTFKMN